MYQPISSVVQIQGTKNPMAVAVCHEGEEFSYAHLNLFASRLANYLKDHQVTQGDVVVLHMRRSFEALAAMLAVWKVGATYLNLDVDTPLARLHLIVNQARPTCVVTEPALLGAIPQQIPQLTCQDPEFINASSVYADPLRTSAQEAAYLVYTSGSTGQPKGVLVTQGNLTNYLLWFNEHFNITPQDVFSFNSSAAFDFSITCTHAPLAAGAKILITSETDVLDIETYCHQLIENQVTFVKWTPSYFKMLINYVEQHKPDFSHLRYLMIAGEELLTHYVERWFTIYPSHSLINEYGPTETTVGITTHLVTRATLTKHLKTIPVGQPVSNTTLYLVDADHQLVSKGEIGELWIGGASVAAGYYHAPELTKTRFIEDPFSKQKVQNLLYKTGDLMKQLPDESYLYVERMDNQVKINGYRIEMAEIEHHLLAHPDVNQAGVIFREDENSNRYIEAYVVLQSKAKSFSTLMLRKHLLQYLPQFMVPQRYFPIDDIPLTPNGKIDSHLLAMKMGETG